MLKVAFLRPRLRDVCEAGVPRQARRVVLFAVGVCDVEDGGFEERRGGVICACFGGGVSGEERSRGDGGGEEEVEEESCWEEHGFLLRGLEG